jgi:accessory colonization factor AcfC
MIKKVFLTMLIGLTVTGSLDYPCDLGAQDKPLRIYGPEGPFAPMKECADIFYRVHGVKTEVLTGAGSNWIEGAKKDADVVYEETEYRLSEFMTRNP